MQLRRTSLAWLAVIVGTSLAHSQEVTVKVGTVRSISTATVLWAADKVYF